MRFRGEGEKPSSDMERIRAMTGVVVIDDRLPRTILVEVEGDASRRHLESLSGWAVAKESFVTVNPHPTLKKPITNP